MKKVLLFLALCYATLSASANNTFTITNYTGCTIYYDIFAMCPNDCSSLYNNGILADLASGTSITYNASNPIPWSIDPSTVCSNWIYAYSHIHICDLDLTVGNNSMTLGVVPPNCIDDFNVNPVFVGSSGNDCGACAGSHTINWYYYYLTNDVVITVY